MTPLERVRSNSLMADGTGWEWETAQFGPDSCPTPAVRGAFMKGWAAAAAGESVHSNPYSEHNVPTRGDRRGRYNAGFRPVYRRAWEIGHAWAIERKAAEPFDEYVLLQALAGQTWDGKRLPSPDKIEPPATRRRRMSYARHGRARGG